MSKIALLFLLVFAGGIIAALFYSGSAAFVLYQLVYFLNPDDRWWSAQIPGLSYSFIASVLMLVVLGVNYKDLSTKSSWSSQAFFKYLALLVLFFYVAKLWAIAPALHDKFSFIYLKLAIIIFVAYKLIDSEAALKASSWAYLIGCTYVGYLATSIGRNSGDRLDGLALPDGSDVNGVAAALVPAGVLLLYYAWMGNKKTRLICFLFGAFVANGLVLFNSRGAFLGVVASCGLFLFYMMFSKYRQKGQRGLAIFIIFVGISGAVYVTDDLFWQRMSTLENPSEPGSGSHRVLFWVTTFDMLEDHPLGMGVYGYNMLSPLYLTREEREGVEYKTVHSIWFQALSEVGWHGLIVFLLMLLSLYRGSKKAKKFVLAERQYQRYFHLLALECALIGYLVTSTFINQFRAEVLYWMLLFLAIGVKVYYLSPSSVSDRSTTGGVCGPPKVSVGSRGQGSK
ncbi:O-antigen polymerase [Marinobacter santoriniensis NKSG1]|uniref:O-antigen polymerase n=1 Tax=Marinobacter santoriniensis NKSG1 TaxID=1288826 RepID=M7CQY9_9GAMM|nr:O-antigen ligase family protein [Marinobacter santoriniensis]EMP55584.1 O-antigen polymerase [Marinobacter santoriniensis NKSG1]